MTLARKSIATAAAVSALVLLSACGGKQSSPEKTVEAFTMSTCKGDKEGALAMFNPDVIKKAGKAKVEAYLSLMEAECTARGGVKKVEILDTTVISKEPRESLKVKYRITYKGDTAAQTSNAVATKFDGRWYVGN